MNEDELAIAIQDGMAEVLQCGLATDAVERLQGVLDNVNELWSRLEPEVRRRARRYSRRDRHFEEDLVGEGRLRYPRLLVR